MKIELLNGEADSLSRKDFVDGTFYKGVGSIFPVSKDTFSIAFAKNNFTILD